MRSASRASSRKRGIAGSIERPILIVMSAPVRLCVAFEPWSRHVDQIACLDRLAGLVVDELQSDSVPRRAVDQSQRLVARTHHVAIAPLAQRDQHVAQVPPACAHPVLGTRPAPTRVVLGRHEDACRSEATQPVRQRRPTDAEPGDEVVEAAHAVHDVTDDEHAPPVAEQVERLGDRAGPRWQPLPVDASLAARPTRSRPDPCGLGELLDPGHDPFHVEPVLLHASVDDALLLVGHAVDRVVQPPRRDPSGTRTPDRRLPSPRSVDRVAPDRRHVVVAADHAPLEDVLGLERRHDARRGPLADGVVGAVTDEAGAEGRPVGAVEPFGAAHLGREARRQPDVRHQRPHHRRRRRHVDRHRAVGQSAYFIGRSDGAGVNRERFWAGQLSSSSER